MDAAVGSAAPPRRRAPNHPTGAAERQRQGGRLEPKIERSRALTLMRGDVNVHHALLAAPKEVGAQARPHTPRGRAALPAGESGAARGRLQGGLPPGPMVTLPERSMLLGGRRPASLPLLHESGRLRQRPRTLARDEHESHARA